MIIYRKALPTDAEPVSKLLLEVSFIFRYLYGNTFPGANLEEKIANNFKNGIGKSTYKSMYVAEDTDTNQVIGLVNYYDADLHTIDVKMREQFSADLLKTIEPLYSSIVPDSLYISALIVDEKYRNYKMGPQLIQHVIDEAKKLNRKYICLHVWDDNQNGIRFYNKNNFTVHGEFTLQTDSDLLPPSKKTWLMGLAV